MHQYHRSELRRFSTEETEYLKGSIDFISLNHYSTLYAKDCIHSPCILGGDHFNRGFAYTTGERDGILIGEPDILLQICCMMSTESNSTRATLLLWPEQLGRVLM